MKKLNLITLFLAVTLAVLPLNANTCLDFDGVDDVAQTPLDLQPSALANTTWEAWVKPTRLFYLHPQTILTTDDGGWDRGIWIAPDFDEIVIGYGTTGWNPGVHLIQDQWHHIAVVYKPDNVLFYFDGVEYSLNQAPAGQNTTANLWIGNSLNTQDYQGQIDEIRIWNDVRTEQEINDNISHVLSGSETGLLAYYKFSEGSGIIAGDSAGSNDGTLHNMDNNDWINTGSFTAIGAGLLGVSSGSVSLGDYDDDGDLDILLTGEDSTSNIISKIYRNDLGTFTDIGAGLAGVSNSSVSWGDYDKDGDLDILLTGNTSLGRISKIYRNDSGAFTDIEAGLLGVSYSSVSWGDYDKDGDLDILLTGMPSAGWISKVYRNDSGSFIDIGAGLTGVYYSSAAWGDYDNDGDLDILLSGELDSGENPISKIYRNDSGTFTDINAGLTAVNRGSVVWGDYDNDGDLDILLTGFTGSSSVSKIYSNDRFLFNTAPETPSNLSSNYVEDDKITFNWDKATDIETSQNGLTYNITIGNSLNINGIKSGQADESTGYRKITELGNTNHVNSFKLEKAYPQCFFTWSVQTIDNNFAGSEFTQGIQIKTRDLGLFNENELTLNDRLKWESIFIDDISDYQIQVSPDENFENLVVDYLFEINSKSYKVTKDFLMFITLNQLNGIESLLHNETYYWRIKPFYIDAEFETFFSQTPSSFIFKADITYDVPSPIDVAVEGNLVTLSWNSDKDTSKSEVYNVYSTDDPYAVFPDGWTLEAIVTNGTQWFTVTSELKKFYCVTSTSGGKEDVETPIHRISK